jgi:ubiquinone/menaquinone biosynthesis C-methylase UbiE
MRDAVSIAVVLVALLSACQSARTGGPEASVNPGINEPYLAPDVDAEFWAGRFEVESREIYASRSEIVRALGLRDGMAIADIGAGTGLFVGPFAREVGPAGRVYAVDIVPAFVKHIDQRARELGLPQVEARLCAQDDVQLPAGSIDIAFVCDVYHHFEFPRSSLESVHAALRPGGELVVIDFVRVPGVSREWILQHVRAGQEVFTSEIEAAGFELVEEVAVEGLEENYFLRFRKE